MKLNELKVLFNASALDKAAISKAPMQDGWLLFIYTTEGKCHVYESQRDKNKKFATIEGAMKIGQKIGFQEFILSTK